MNENNNNINSEVTEVSVTQQAPAYATQESPTKESKAFAIVGMILGIVSVVLCCNPYVGIPCAIVGLIFSIMTIVGKKAGKGMAIAGLVLSIIGLIIVIIMLVAGTTFLATLPFGDLEQYIDSIK